MGSSLASFATLAVGVGERFPFRLKPKPIAGDSVCQLRDLPPNQIVAILCMCLAPRTKIELLT
jgi:hypothetical protein